MNRHALLEILQFWFENLKLLSEAGSIVLRWVKQPPVRLALCSGHCFSSLPVYLALVLPPPATMSET